MNAGRPPWHGATPTGKHRQTALLSQLLSSPLQILRKSRNEHEGSDLAGGPGIVVLLVQQVATARQRGAFLIGFNSHAHADGSAPTHPARHPTRQNLHDIVDIAIDTKVPIGDALVTVEGVGESIAAVSTFANAFALNCLVIRTVAKLAERGVEPPIWRSGNAPGGDEANGRFLARFRDRVRWL